MNYDSFPSENEVSEKIDVHVDDNEEEDAELIESVVEWALFQARNSLKQKKRDKIDIGRDFRRIKVVEGHYDCLKTPSQLRNNLEYVYERGCDDSREEKVNGSSDQNKHQVIENNIAISEHCLTEKLDASISKEQQYAPRTSKDTFTRSKEYTSCVEKTHVLDYKLDQILHNMHDHLKSRFASKHFKKIRKEIQPFFEELKKECVFELSKMSQTGLVHTISLDAHSTISGPPPSPPPLPPPAPINVHHLPFKLKTVSSDVDIILTGDMQGIEELEIRLKDKSKQEDLISQLQQRLKSRSQRESLAQKYKNLSIDT